MIITTMLDTELATPSQNVRVPGARPWAQYAEKNSGKKPAITVVANDELAQSYNAHDHRARGDVTSGHRQFQRQHQRVFATVARRVIVAALADPGEAEILVKLLRRIVGLAHFEQDQRHAGGARHHQQMP